MFHKNLLSSKDHQTPPQNSAGLTLVRHPARADVPAQNPLADLLLIAARRSSSFCAEAAVLVLVFGILDLAILKGHIDPAWIAGALGLSLVLLAASIATDFGAHRWIKAHP